MRRRGNPRNEGRERRHIHITPRQPFCACDEIEFVAVVPVAPRNRDVGRGGYSGNRGCKAFIQQIDSAAEPTPRNSTAAKKARRKKSSPPQRADPTRCRP